MKNPPSKRNWESQKISKNFFSSNLKKFQRQQKNLKDDEIIKVEKGDKDPRDK